MKRRVMISATAPSFPHNCFRCGNEFQGSPYARVCPACRKPPYVPVHKRDPQAVNAPFQALQLSHGLTPRERQIAELVSQGHPNKEIGFRLHLTEGTIKEYLNRIFRKLDCENRVCLTVYWIKRQGCISS